MMSLITDKKWKIFMNFETRYSMHRGSLSDWSEETRNVLVIVENQGTAGDLELCLTCLT